MPISCDSSLFKIHFSRRGQLSRDIDIILLHTLISYRTSRKTRSSAYTDLPQVRIVGTQTVTSQFITKIRLYLKPYLFLSREYEPRDLLVNIRREITLVVISARYLRVVVSLRVSLPRGGGGPPRRESPWNVHEEIAAMARRSRKSRNGRYPPIEYRTRPSASLARRFSKRRHRSLHRRGTLMRESSLSPSRIYPGHSRINRLVEPTSHSCQYQVTVSLRCCKSFDVCNNCIYPSFFFKKKKKKRRCPTIFPLPPNSRGGHTKPRKHLEQFEHLVRGSRAIPFEATAFLHRSRVPRRAHREFTAMIAGGRARGAGGLRDAETRLGRRRRR